MSTSLAIVIVSYNTRALLAACLESLAADASLGLPTPTGSSAALTTRVVVVDNDSSDGSRETAQAQFPWVDVIASPTNLGFAGGNNLALRHVLSTAIDYVFLLNPDTESRGDALPMLVRYLEAHPDVAVVGPRLVYPDGSVQPSRRRFPTRGVYFW